MKKTLILCGLPGTGKTESGKRLAALLNFPYVDTDLYLEKFYEQLNGTYLSCREMYRQLGEKSFRDLENQLLKSMGEIDDSVVSIGGGTLENRENIPLLKTWGRIIYLKNRRGVIFDRLIKKGVPAYLDPDDPVGSFERLADKREKIFESAADFVFDTGSLTPDEVARHLMEHMARG